MVAKRKQVNEENFDLKMGQAQSEEHQEIMDQSALLLRDNNIQSKLVGTSDGLACFWGF